MQQQGSLVDADKTRFDFSHNAPITDEQVRRVEALVNAEILANAATQARIMSFDDAVRGGAMALFGEKYGDEVRVLDIGSSRELCGGTHVARTGDIGFFKIYSQSGVAAGVRRVEATTGEGALAYVQQLDAQLKRHRRRAQGAGRAKRRPRSRRCSSRCARSRRSSRASRASSPRARATTSRRRRPTSRASRCWRRRSKARTPRSLRDTLDQLKNKLKSAAIVLAAVDAGKVQLAAGVTADAMNRIKAGELVNFVAQQVGGKGGGRPDMAMAGGTDASKLPRGAGQREGMGGAAPVRAAVSCSRRLPRLGG